MCFWVTRNSRREMIKEKYSLKWLKVRELWRSQIKQIYDTPISARVCTKSCSSVGILLWLEVLLSLQESPPTPTSTPPVYLAFVAHAEGMGLLTQRDQETTLHFIPATDTDSRGEETIGILKSTSNISYNSYHLLNIYYVQGLCCPLPWHSLFNPHKECSIITSPLKGLATCPW